MKKLLIILILFPGVLAGCASAPKTTQFDPVARFNEAEQLMAKGSFEKAREAYQDIQQKTPDKSYNADIMLRVADTYFGEEKYDEAQVEYQAFLNFHPVHKNASYAQYQLAMCSYKQLPTIDRDPAITRNALKEFEKLQQKYPNSSYLDQARKSMSICRERLAEHELYIERFYYKKGSYRAAVGRAEDLVKQFPDSLVEKDALYYAALSYLELGDKGSALRTFETIAGKYPSLARTVEPYIKKLRPM